MEEHSSVNSRRRILSFSKDRTTDVSFSCRTRFRVSRQNGAKTSEVYGFVGFITTLAATVSNLSANVILIFGDASLCMVSTTEHVLTFQDLELYSNTLMYWALSVPTHVMVTIVLAIGLYIDEYSKEPLSSIPATNDDEQAIEPISDIGTNQVNGMFNNLKWEPC
ncbi:hypothetical protein DH2020_023369 [Rehmannia glutinosa]|uniref:Uncharacterized protein n=1 Tax=Rehmannia glutinosa TaxID=99300 RepID=A0ABR0W8E0_REHGL